ncbi:hypothetical protein chiPu_0022218 [Chiloscyllium punctatum]|uniref:Uncharacterized protein n=1 Tax=Chiloscyllium punctatum TaxID=137246 RepID=A0A401RE98_CHIPU|nr:hypothetical protein [Chiloscyllium punctatum]
MGREASCNPSVQQRTPRIEGIRGVLRDQKPKRNITARSSIIRTAVQNIAWTRKATRHVHTQVGELAMDWLWKEL